MSAEREFDLDVSAERYSFTGCRVLEVFAVNGEEFAYLETRFGAAIEVDRVGDFYLVHRDRPTSALRRARVANIQTSFRPAHCEHCADAVARGGLYLYDSRSHAPKLLRIAPIERRRAEDDCCARVHSVEKHEETIYATT